MNNSSTLIVGNVSTYANTVTGTATLNEHL